jgi:hypothetical protein
MSYMIWSVGSHDVKRGDNMNSLHLVAGLPRTPYAAKPITFHVPRFHPENFAALLPLPLPMSFV